MLRIREMIEADQDSVESLAIGTGLFARESGRESISILLKLTTAGLSQ